MTDTSFIESEERQALRKAVASWVANYGHEYYLDKARKHEHTSELWAEAGKLGFLGVNLPEEYGGGGAGMYELSLVMEEMAAAGSALLLMVVSPAINGTIIAKFGTDDQKKRWLPGIADGSLTMAFAITEPDAGSNSHKITTTARRDGSDWIIKGQKVFISGIDQAQAVLWVTASTTRPPWYKPIWALRLNPVATDTVAARSGAFTTILRSASYAATPTAPVTTVGTAFARNPCYTIADAPFVCRCPEKHRSPALVTCCWHPASAPRWPTRRPRHRRAARVDRSAPA